METTLVHRCDVDGVACFWVDTGRPTLRARLVFRHGLVDEPLRASGWTHLVEHLALHDAPRGALTTNGSVDLRTTSFDAHGPSDLVASHLAAVTSFLADPQVADVEHEAQILAAERSLRGGMVGRALAERYGAVGPGVLAYGELGLSRVTKERIRELLRRSFTRENAALVLDGPPPTDLLLRLPTGSRQPLADVGRGLPPFPMMYIEEEGVTVSGLVERTTAATLLPEALANRLFDSLRRQGGGAYAPWGTYEAIDAHRAVVLAGSDVSDHLHPTLATRVLDVVNGLCTPEPTLVEELVQARVQEMSDPYLAVMHAFRAAMWHLEGREAETPTDWIAQMSAVGPEAVAEAARSVKNSLLLGIPPETIWRDELPRSQPPPVPHATGLDRPRRHRNWPARRELLRTGPGGIVHLRDRASDASRFAVASTAEVVVRDSTGRRTVIGADGWSLTIDPREWRRGDEVSAQIDAATPPDRHVHLPGPADPPWQRAAWWRRLLYVTPRPWHTVAVILGAIAWLGLFVLAIVLERPGTIVLMALITGVWLYRRRYAGGG